MPVVKFGAQTAVSITSRSLKRTSSLARTALATTDHNVPTTPRKNFVNVAQFVEEEDSRTQCVTLEDNVEAFGLTYFGLGDARQGIVHIIGPEQGFTLPGTTVVCGDSHTSTHGKYLVSLLQVNDSD